jgi:hypothetical protein
MGYFLSRAKVENGWIFNASNAIESELFNLHPFRSSTAETTEEVLRKGKSKG